MIKPQHLIFEGVELAGKSFIISKIYDLLEPSLNSNTGLLDGCQWFNCDVGIFGSKQGRPIIINYIKMAKTLRDRHIIFEKFHIADKVYNKIYNNTVLNYKKTEKQLKKLGFKIIFLSVKEDEKIFEQRLSERLKLYPHYKRIAQTPSRYIYQQKIYKETLKNTALPVLEVDSSQLPSEKIIKDIMSWIEK